MNSRLGFASDAELEAALRDLGTALDYPSGDGIAGAVRARLQGNTGAATRSAHTVTQVPRPSRLAAEPRPARGRFTRRRRVAIIALLVAALCAAALAAAPPARSTVIHLLHIFGVSIQTNPAVPRRPIAPVGTALQLGDRVSLATVERRARYHVAVPTLQGFRAPDEVYVRAIEVGLPPYAQQVALVYRARPGLPALGHSHVGLLLTEVPGSPSAERLLFGKMIEPGTRIRAVTVAGAPGYWLSGHPHVFYYFAPDSSIVTESLRFAGDTLLWPNHGLTLRLESALPLDRVLAIAASLR